MRDLVIGGVACALIVAGSARLAGRPNPAAQSPTPAAKAVAAGDVQRGQQLYVKYGCYQCHGREAQGGAAGPRLGPGSRPYAEFDEYVRVPTGEMPPYTTKVLSDAELRDIHAFTAARPRPQGRPALLR